MSSVFFARYIRLTALFFVRVWFVSSFFLYWHVLRFFSFAMRSSPTTVFTPQDIRISDPTIGDDIYGGRFCFAGQVALAKHQSIFAVLPPSSAWKDDLLCFGWLRHLRATNSPISQVCVRTLIDDWIQCCACSGFFYDDPDIVACRVISFLQHSNFILDGASPVYCRRFFSVLTFQVRFLRWVNFCLPHDQSRLTSVIVLNYSVLCMSGFDRLQPLVARWLDQELFRQIFPDGGHISRNPEIISDLLLYLLPLRQTFSACDIVPPLSLLSSIDRMMSMVRFFRHGDGGLALFNGASDRSIGDLSIVLSRDDTYASPVCNAIHSGYQRASCGNSIFIMDTGFPPPINVSHAAHASCTSFEFSIRSYRLIVNCGSPYSVGSEWRDVSRLTAAHSTVIIDDASSCDFAHGNSLSRAMQDVILSGPDAVNVRHMKGLNHVMIDSVHDGYWKNYGILCRRKVLLRQDGSELFGEDSFEVSDSFIKDAGVPYAIRFHLHPDIVVRFLQDRHIVLLTLPDMEVWAMAVNGGQVRIEDSVYMPRPGGPCRTSQIVIYGRIFGRSRVSWVFQRMCEVAYGLSDISRYSVGEKS